MMVVAAMMVGAAAVVIVTVEMETSYLFFRWVNFLEVWGLYIVSSILFTLVNSTIYKGLFRLCMDCSCHAAPLDKVTSKAFRRISSLPLTHCPQTLRIAASVASVSVSLLCFHVKRTSAGLAKCIPPLLTVPCCCWLCTQAHTSAVQTYYSKVNHCLLSFISSAGKIWKGFQEWSTRSPLHQLLIVSRSIFFIQTSNFHHLEAVTYSVFHTLFPAFKLPPLMWKEVAVVLWRWWEQ